MKRAVVIWFPYLKTEWHCRRQPALQDHAFVLAIPDHGRMVITAASEKAIAQSIYPGMVAADAKAICPVLQVIEDEKELAGRLLKRIATWCIRFSPCVAVDGDDGIFIDATGCTHLWGGDAAYLHTIRTRFRENGYTVRVAIADTIGAAWAVARFGNEVKSKDKENFVVEPGQHAAALLLLPAAALRLDNETVERLNKLGLRQVKDFIAIPKAALRRRFGVKSEQTNIITRINQALGYEDEIIVPVIPPAAYEERLPCPEPISTATGIEIALERLLEALCTKLKKEGKGIRSAILKCFRVDGNIESITIGTIRASHHTAHLFSLFALKIATIEPALGIELFILEATKVEEHHSLQAAIWHHGAPGLADERISELLDRLRNKIPPSSIRRYLPAEHYWPERSVKGTQSLDDVPDTTWKAERPRPLQLLSRPAPIQVTAPIPDYPPMNFRYKGKLHTITKAEGPERIEQEWWIEEGQHRDYYHVEDESGCRYWLFRLGHYDDASYKWFLHGVFV